MVLGIVAAASVSLVPATPAHANNCQPEELVFGEGNSAIGKTDSPVCFVFETWMYPFLCPNADPNGNGETDPIECSMNLSPRLQNLPNLGQVTQYQPNANRIVCSAVNFTFARLGLTGGCGS